jgi:putative nucleotidyltransferase with HDIG domain
MKYISLDGVEPGQHLGKTVYSSNGTILLAAGVQLTVYMINTLNRIGVTMLYIEDADFDDIETEDILSESTKRALFNEMHDTFEALRSGKEWGTKRLSVSVNKIMEDILINKELLVQLTDIRTMDNAIYVHAMNVCLISTLIGMNMGLNAVQLKDLAIGALLHDVGKTRTEDSSEGTAEDLTEHHTWRGFEHLKNKREFNLLIAHIALQHHEHIDGSGIPRGLVNEDIHQFAKIVAVANCYDNLIDPLFEGGGMLPHVACEKLMAMSEKELDHHVLVQFNRIISVYPNGSSVRLSTKETGVVVRQHRGLPGRPVVRIIEADKQDYTITEIDLAQQTTVFIESVLA